MDDMFPSEDRLKEELSRLSVVNVCDAILVRMESHAEERKCEQHLCVASHGAASANRLQPQHVLTHPASDTIAGRDEFKQKAEAEELSQQLQQAPKRCTGDVCAFLAPRTASPAMFAFPS